MQPQSPTSPQVFDVIVIGGGNAGFSAASTAAQTLHLLSPSTPPRILLLEKAPRESSGGNTFYTAGAYRFTFDSLSDLRPILSHNNSPNIPDSLASRIILPPYTAEHFHADLLRVTSNRADPALAEILIGQSRNAVEWIAKNGGKWELSFHRQAYEVDGKFKFWGGLVVCFKDGGKGLVKWHEEFAERVGVEVWYDSEVVDLLVDNDDSNGLKVTGVEVSVSGKQQKLLSKGGVILATGGFQANPSLRAQWLGADWKAAHVRGSATNTGDGHNLTLLSPQRRVRAKSAGHYQGCHSVCWDSASPRQGGDRVLTNQYTKSGYPLGIMVNSNGERFVDEGVDLRNYTYAVFGREVLKQPGGVAWQIWDAEGRKLLRDEEYSDSVTELVVADDLSAIAEKLKSMGLAGKEKLLETVDEFNATCKAFMDENPNVKFDPARKDGLSTQSAKTGLTLPKSNWARPLLSPPFTAVKVTCGVTFTFGGLAVIPETAEVLAESDREPEQSSSTELNSSTHFENHQNGRKFKGQDRVIRNLFCCGELLGGLFWDNYPGGSGLTAGTVFGRIAGRCAAERAHGSKNGSDG